MRVIWNKPHGPLLKPILALFDSAHEDDSRMKSKRGRIVSVSILPVKKGPSLSRERRSVFT